MTPVIYTRDQAKEPRRVERRLEIVFSLVEKIFQLLKSISYYIVSNTDVKLKVIK
jgi:hypothetical protein